MIFRIARLSDRCKVTGCLTLPLCCVEMYPSSIEAGRDLEAQVMDIWTRLEKTTKEGLTEQEREMLLTVSRKIEANIDSNS